MLMKRIQVFVIVVAITTISVFAFGFAVYRDRDEAVANQASRYQQLENFNAGYKESAAESGIPNADQVPVLRPANKDSQDLKPIQQMKGFMPESNYKNGTYYEIKETLTYEDLINKYTEFDLDPSISKDRVVNVTVTRYPNGFDHRRGFVKNAVLTKAYDAETGDFLGSSIRSLDPDGMGIKKGNTIK